MIESDHRGPGKVLKEQSFLESQGCFSCRLATLRLAAWQRGLFPTKLGSQRQLLKNLVGWPLRDNSVTQTRELGSSIKGSGVCGI